MKTSSLRTLAFTVLGASFFVSGAMATGTAKQEIQTFTVSSTALPFVQDHSFNQFDSTLGTLTSIEFSIGGTTVTFTSLKNGTGSQQTYTVASGADLRIQTTDGTVVFDQAIVSKSVGLTLGAGVTGQTANLVSSGTATYVYDASGNYLSDTETGKATLGVVPGPVETMNVSDYIGAGTFVLQVTGGAYTSLAGTGFENATTSGTSNATVTVTYNYLQAIPEPSTWAMLVGGVGALGFVQRMRRRA